MDKLTLFGLATLLTFPFGLQSPRNVEKLTPPIQSQVAPKTQALTEAKLVELPPVQTYEPALFSSQSQRLETALTSLSQKLTCPQGSVLTVVPHQDDDILFTSPDLLDEINAGKCITTIYLTAGDAGASTSYWTTREQGAEAAYASMLGQSTDQWQHSTIDVDGQQIAASQTEAAARVTLLFFRLPDGNLDGQGFAKTQFASLHKLYDGSMITIQSIDGSASYSKDGLVHTLGTLMDKYRPDQIRTLDYDENLLDGDHSDHHAAGAFTKLAFQNYSNSSSLRTYMGYPGGGLPENIPVGAQAAKNTTFYAYGMHDAWTCSSDAACQHSPYYTYLRHQYSKLYER